jgi:hypothetical protein
MAIEQNTRGIKDNEIDLLDVLSQVWKGLSKAVRVTSVFLIRKSLWLAGFILLGACIAFIFYKNSQQYYTSTMIARANVLSNSYVIDYIKQFLGTKDSLTFAHTLNIPVSAAKHILNCNAFFGIDTDGDGNVDYVDVNNSFRFDSKDTIKRKVPKIFYLKLTVAETSVFPVISEGLIAALKNNPHFVAQNEVRIAHLKEKITGLETQYRLLDSLERFDYFESEKLTKRNTGQVLVLNEKERHLYHEPLIKLHDSILLYKQELALYSEPITVIRDFHAPSAADSRDFPALSVVNSPLMHYMKTWMLAFFIMGVVFLIIRHHRTKIWKLIKEK